MGGVLPEKCLIAEKGPLVCRAVRKKILMRHPVLESVSGTGDAVALCREDQGVALHLGFDRGASATRVKTRSRRQSLQLLNRDCELYLFPGNRLRRYDQGVARGVAPLYLLIPVRGERVRLIAFYGMLLYALFVARALFALFHCGTTDARQQD